MPPEKISKILKLLKKEYPGARIMLRYSSPMELLVATILSAQCTDKMVNRVTEPLFKKYRSVKDFAGADLKEFQAEIRSTGFFRNKAKNIINSARKILKEFGGQVPDSMEKLIQLPGVARKTANIVLINIFHKSVGIPVDTHVRCISQRLGLTRQEQPEKIEIDLMKLLPKKEWARFSYLLIEHGRAICLARSPRCPVCSLKKLCPSSYLGI